LGVWVLVITTDAYIGARADVQAGSNVQVSARDVDNTSMLAGSAAFSSSAAVGAAVGVPVIVRNTTASINTEAKVDALGGGQAIDADTGEFDVTFGDPVFDPATAVDLTNGWITLSYEHGFRTGEAVVYDKGAGGTDLGSLTSGTTYYVINDPSNPKRLKLAKTEDDAKKGKAITLTSKGAGTNHTIKPVGSASA